MTDEIPPGGATSRPTLSNFIISENVNSSWRKVVVTLQDDGAFVRLADV